ncbi:MAG: DUF262 domain-containing protein [Spirochaetia bacterium]|nr:DUF262 domain-containing protein [Spirochaetia bacterium]
MKTNSTTFWDLLNSYTINIPMIQRDYAQGRESEEEKRNKFLDTMYSNLENNSNLHLDFVYGKIEKNIFYPIDGQQRLTTLYLLHWYFALKEQVDNSEFIKLKKFIYNTRISSREFCCNLISNNISISNANTGSQLIETIKDQSWYRLYWEYDPTIKAMLNMISAIHDKFKSINSNSVFKQLKDNKTISFEMLDLGANGFELTDELYIKMNARGKQLTSFENFKANFIQFLEQTYKNTYKLKHPIKGEISYSGYFSYKIEKEWTDLFWAFRSKEISLDIGLSNYFEFITQMLYFKENKDTNADCFKNKFFQYKEIYKEKDNLLFLFNSLDKLYEIFSSNNNYSKKNLNDLFTKINERVIFFWNNGENNNIFQRIFENVKTEDARNKIMFFCILNYLIKHNLSTISDNFLYYLRIVRNLIQATRQKNETKYNTNIRINNFGNYWTLFDKIATLDVYKTIQEETLINSSVNISKNSLINEIEKVEILELEDNQINEALFGLEECNEFKGMIHNLNPKKNFKEFPDYLKAFHEIWDKDIEDYLRVQALIASGFEGRYIKSTKMGETYYFGGNDNWESVLTENENKVSSSLVALLKKYIKRDEITARNKLQSIINDWLNENINDRSYKYYFLKYPSFLSKRNYFVWPNDNEISMLSTEGSNPLIAYHISPYVLTVCKIINNSNICDEKLCYHLYSGNSQLILKNNIVLESIEAGWKIYTENEISNVIIKMFNIEQNEDNYLLKDNIDKDRIEIATDFINEIIKLEQNVL